MSLCSTFNNITFLQDCPRKIKIGRNSCQYFSKLSMCHLCLSSIFFSGCRARYRTGNKTGHEENELSECKEFSLYGNQKRTINEWKLCSQNRWITISIYLCSEYQSFMYTLTCSTLEKSFKRYLNHFNLW